MGVEIDRSKEPHELAPILELEGVARTYPGPPPVTALHPADLTVHQGDLLSIVGPSGSGKSTLLNIVGLLDRPTEGTYRLDGDDVSQLSEAERTRRRAVTIGFVFQSFHLLAHRKAVENVSLAQVYAGVPRRERVERSREALDRVGLSHRSDALPLRMSGGERQRVAIARALVTRPRLILADEPTGNLDSATGESVLDLFDELNQSGLTVLVITHDPVVAARARRTVELRDGRLRELVR